jgi:parvulin-like peptidyl-prolyl isomerase
MRLQPAAFVLGLVAFAAGPLAAQTLLDRVVVRVNGSVVLLSDVRAAAALGLIEAAPDTQDAVEQMVQRTLLVEEVNRFPPPEPTGEAVDAELARLRTRAGGSLDAVERETGITADHVRLFARDRLRIQGYIDQRFGLTVPLSEEQVLQYYRTHPEEFTANGALVPFDRAQGLARERAGLEQRQRTIDQWLRDLRARADVSVQPR